MVFAARTLVKERIAVAHCESVLRFNMLELGVRTDKKT